MGSIVLYESQKANGENVQISYFAPKQAWIISSKNIAIIARTREDIETFTESRYQYSKLMAQSWFDILEKSGDKKTEAMKEFFSKYTLVGEYTGNPEYQHLVKYESLKMIFFAIVENGGSIDAIPPKEGFNKIKEFGLDCVEYKEHAPCKTKAALAAALLAVSQTTSCASLE